MWCVNKIKGDNYGHVPPRKDDYFLQRVYIGKFLIHYVILGAASHMSQLFADIRTTHRLCHEIRVCL